MMKSRLRQFPANPITFLASVALAMAMILPLVNAQPSAFAQANDDLVGEYSVSLTKDDVPTTLAGGDSYIGRWRIEFAADGTYSAERQDVGVVISGTYMVDGDQLEITDESGLLSCSNATAGTIKTGSIGTGTYEWASEGTSISFVTVEDGCVGRVLLLTTRPFTTFVPCETEPLAQTEVAPLASPEAVDSTADTSTTGALDVLTPAASSENGEAVTEETLDQVAPQIDLLLLQMTACWATGDPDRWLPLLSTEFRAALAGQDPAGFTDTLAAAMAVPIVWERAGDLSVENETGVSAIVRSTIGTEEDFQRFGFILENGEWRWNE